MNIRRLRTVIVEKGKEGREGGGEYREDRQLWRRVKEEEWRGEG